MTMAMQKLRMLALLSAVFAGSGHSLRAQQPPPLPPTGRAGPIRPLPTPTQPTSAPTTATLDPRGMPKAPPAGPAPTGVAATVINPISVRINWAAVPNAIGYQIMRRGVIITPAPVMGTQYVDAVLP